MNWLPYLNIACVLVFAGLLFWAAQSDVRTYRIPNWISLAIAAVFVPFLLSSGKPLLAGALNGYGTGAVMLGIGFLLFAGKIMGGGDAKLLSAIGIWSGSSHIGTALLTMAVVGGTMAILIVAFMPLQQRLRGKAFRDKVRNTKLPYGVAIAAGGFYTAWQLAAPTVQHFGL